MKNLFSKLIYLFLLFISSTSCLSDKKGYEFSNFKDTPLEELANYVKNNDIDAIKDFAKEKRIDLNYKEPIYNQTLLSLAIANNKKAAFIKLLELGADPNAILGSANNSSPLTLAIEKQRNCDLFYIENLLKHGADPNLCINPADDAFFYETYPLFVAVGKGVNGDECLDVIKTLIKYGADINVCNPKSTNKNYCEGVISLCISYSCMDFLKFFVIEKKIKIPDVVYIDGGIDENTQKKYSLKEILNTEDYQFDEYPSAKAAKDDVLNYLKRHKI